MLKSRGMAHSNQIREFLLTDHGVDLLDVYVGMTPRSSEAIQNIKEICEDHLKGRYNLEVIDIYRQRSLAKGEQIIAIPTLEIEDLRIRLAEAEEILQAIQRGEVDAVVVSGPQGDQVFTLQSADYPYRIFLEAMHEGAVTLGLDGTIVYGNHRFSEIIQTPLEQLIGTSIHRFIAPGDRKTFESAISRRGIKDGKAEIYLKRKKGPPVPVLLSINLMGDDEGLLICVVVTDLTEIKKAEATLAESEKQLRLLASQLLKAQEKERKRIAGEIHDILGSNLSAAKYNLENLQSNYKDNGLERISVDLNTSISLLNETIREVRRIQADLRPPVLDDLGILPAFAWLCRRFQTIYSSVGIETKFELQEEEIPDPLKISIFRIAQESLNNIAKHAQADRVLLTLCKVNSRIELTIQDNGEGFDLKSLTAQEDSNRGLGLASMKERTEISDGRFHIESSPGKGTVVKAAWPA